ncbi:MAG: HAMP domain-containing histidine kinase [Leptospiraceae bacterium]|nr:HAMP domain-containing histidine kinase [Leptospiraceae bacterium]
MPPTHSNKESSSRAIQPVARSTEDLPALAAGLVHEAKNPLASIHLHLQLLEGYLQEVEDSELREKLRAKARFIKSEITGLDQSLHNFLKLIRQEQRRQQQNINLDATLQRVIDLLSIQAHQAGIELEFQAGAITEVQNADEGFIRQIAINLIINSIQALASDTPADSESAAAEPGTRRIIVRTGRHENHSYMMVADNGPGIPLELQERIFEPYFTTKSSQGSGIGLTLVRRMAAEMRARLDIQSQPGKGTSVTLFFAENEEDAD